jgi:Leucine-rich repeat (LRR) protein
LSYLFLEFCALEHNQLSGTLPTEIGNLLKMVTMYWHNNAMTGPLPSQLGKLSKLEQLQLNDNKFTGSIPTEIGTMINMLVLDLSKSESSELERLVLLLNW